MPGQNTDTDRGVGCWIAIIALLAALLAAGLWTYLGMTVSLDEPSRRASATFGNPAVAYPLSEGLRPPASKW